MFLTKKEQELILEMFNNGKKITVNGQTSYQSHFIYDTISKLAKLDLVKSRVNPWNKRKRVYLLTDRGFIVGHILANPKDTNQYFVVHI